jgi:hypothetical protein
MIKQSLTRIFLASSLIVFETFVFIPNSQAAACATSETTYSTYKVITFTSTGTCTWTAPTDISSGDILLIGGGGGGGGGAYGGGAGAGGFVEKLNHTFTAGNTYTISIGTGGTGGAATLSSSSYPNGNFGLDGGDTIFDSLTAKGGGGGPGYSGGGGANARGRTGGSGSGSSEAGGTGGASTQSPFTGASTYGFGGGSSNGCCAKAGGGGGGAGSAGNPADAVLNIGGLGGNGRSSTLRTGSAITYAAGGDGGSQGSIADRTNKASNSGNGGDGANWLGGSGASGAGGSGILVIRYSAASPTPAAPTSLVATAGDAQASISFTAGSDGGSAITNYKYSLDGTTFTALSPSVITSPVTITGLTNGTTYNIYLKAVNTAGDGTASSSVSVTPVASNSGGGSSSSSQTIITPIVTTTNSGNKKIISWDQPTDLVLTTYNKTTKKTKVSTLSGGEAIIAKPKPGQSATYTITSATGEVVKTFTVKSKPETPKKVEVAIQATTLSATWKKSIGAKKYRVTITPEVGTPITLITTDPNISIELDSPGKATLKIVAIGTNGLASKSVSKTI